MSTDRIKTGLDRHESKEDGTKVNVYQNWKLTLLRKKTDPT